MKNKFLLASRRSFLSLRDSFKDYFKWETEKTGKTPWRKKVLLESQKGSSSVNNFMVSDSYCPSLVRDGIERPMNFATFVGLPGRIERHYFSELYVGNERIVLKVIIKKGEAKLIAYGIEGKVLLESYLDENKSYRLKIGEILFSFSSLYSEYSTNEENSFFSVTPCYIEGLYKIAPPPETEEPFFIFGVHGDKSGYFSKRIASSFEAKGGVFSFGIAGLGFQIFCENLRNGKYDVDFVMIEDIPFGSFYFRRRTFFLKGLDVDARNCLQFCFAGEKILLFASSEKNVLVDDIYDNQLTPIS